MIVSVQSSSGSIVIGRSATATVLRAGCHDHEPGAESFIHYIVIGIGEDGRLGQFTLQANDLKSIRAVVAACNEGLAQVESALQAEPVAAGVVG